MIFFNNPDFYGECRDCRFFCYQEILWLMNWFPTGASSMNRYLFLDNRNRSDTSLPVRLNRPDFGIEIPAWGQRSLFRVGGQGEWEGHTSDRGYFSSARCSLHIHDAGSVSEISCLQQFFGLVFSWYWLNSLLLSLVCSEDNYRFLSKSFEAAFLSTTGQECGTNNYLSEWVPFEDVRNFVNVRWRITTTAEQLFVFAASIDIIK